MDPKELPCKRILLVDDDFLLRELVTMTLAGAGYMVATAANGEEALQRLRNFHPPQLILLDLMLPGMDGWRFREEQQKDQALASIPVIVSKACESASITSSAPCAVETGCSGWTSANPGRRAIFSFRRGLCFIVHEPSG